MEDSIEENSSGSVYSRYRSPAFSHKETKALLDIIDKYKTIVLNKNTSGAASRAKEVTWLKITKIFNSQGFKHTRSAECLKMKWLNLKRNVRKVSSNLIDAGTSEIDDVAKQTVMMICEAENNTSMVNEPTESELDLIIDEHKQTNDSHWNGNGDKESYEYTADGDNENESRYRSPTFSQAEVKALLNIIDKYKTVVMNKSVSAAANHAKDVTWTKIAKIFNSQGFKHTRTAYSLKTKWGNLKKEVRSVPDNLIGAKHSECDDGVRQMIAAICEAENNILKVEEPMESDSDPNFNDEIEEDKQKTNDSLWNGNEDRGSDESVDGDNENEESAKRSMNFSSEDCSLLLRCVRPEKHIVFSKKTSASANKIKNLAWKRISNSYNKLSPQKRSTKVLRTKFTNMKRMMTKVKLRDYLKDLGMKHPKQEDSHQFQKIKAEPLFDCKGDPDPDDDDVIGHNGTDVASDNGSHSNPAHDPLSAVLTDSGISSINLSENKEVVKLKLELLNYKLETAKLKRKRLQDLAQSEAAERETRSAENALRLRAARLEVTAAEMKLPPTHPALAHTPEEARAQHFIHQYHAT